MQEPSFDHMVAQDVGWVKTPNALPQHFRTRVEAKLAGFVLVHTMICSGGRAQSRVWRQIPIDVLRGGLRLRWAGRPGDRKDWDQGVHSSCSDGSVGIIHPGELYGAVADTELCCLPTHGTSVAISGAAAVSCAIASAMGGAGSPEEVVNAAVRGAELGATRGRAVAAPSIARRIQWAVDMALSRGDEVAACRDLYELVGTTVATTETVPVALALFALAGGDPIRTAILAANTGGDCDTVGAVACSIAGAYAGISAFPEETIHIIEQVNNLGLKDVALSLLGTLPG